MMYCTSIREDFTASHINLDLLSYQKNPRVMSSSLRKLFEAFKTIPLISIKSERTFITKFRCSLGAINARFIYFEKATDFCEISTLLLTGTI